MQVSTVQPLLQVFIEENVEELIARVGTRVQGRKLPGRSTPYSAEGLRPLFARLARRLKSASPATQAKEKLEPASDAGEPHLSSEGMTIAQMIHGYGDICQVVTELAVERNVGISAAEFRTFNGCLDDAIAEAATDYSRARDSALLADGAERVGELVHELRNVLGTAVLSFDSIKRGVAGTQGSVSNVHTRSLGRLRDLVDRAFSAVRLEAGIIQRERVSVADLIAEAEIAGALRARAHNLELFVATAEDNVFVDVDRQMIAGAIANLLHNAFKFSRPNSLVSLSVQVAASRVRIEVQDECGGLPGGETKELFLPFVQSGSNRSGLGLGLGIARKAVEANGGELRVLDLPLLGCRFTIDLPRLAAAT